MAGEDGAPISFAAAAQKDSGQNTPLRVVQVECQVVLKIAKHCRENVPNLVTGSLLGLDIGQTLEVTDCFPFPARATESEEGADGASYQLDMMKCLRDVNVDNNTVGWYQSTVAGSFQTMDLIETFISYQDTIRRCVCIVHDPEKAGLAALKAIRLKESFVQAYKLQELTAEKLRASSVTWKDVFEEIPIQVHNSPLVRAMLVEVEPSTELATQLDAEQLDLSFSRYLGRNLELLNDCLDDLVSEQQRISIHARNVARQQQQQAQWLQKRRQENAQRRAAGEEPLPEEDPTLFRSITEPTQLENYLITNQLNTYCEQINDFSSQCLQKLYFMESLHESA